jgi:hypothetical protein
MSSIDIIANNPDCALSLRKTTMKVTLHTLLVLDCSLLSSRHESHTHVPTSKIKTQPTRSREHSGDFGVQSLCREVHADLQNLLMLYLGNN